MGETQENSHSPKCPPFSTIVSSRQGRMLGAVVWSFRGEESSSYRDGKPVFAVPAEVMGHRVDSDL